MFLERTIAAESSVGLMSLFMSSGNGSDQYFTVSLISSRLGRRALCFCHMSLVTLTLLYSDASKRKCVDIAVNLIRCDWEWVFIMSKIQAQCVCT